MANLYLGDSEKRTRFHLVDLLPRGTAGGGNEPLSIGSGLDIPLVIKVPSTQTVDAVQLQLANGTINAAGGNTVLWSLAGLTGQPNYLGGVAGGGLCCTQYALTAAQINAMYPVSTNSITIVPAPAAGFAIVVSQIVVELILTATAFAAGGVVHFTYHGQTTELMAEALAAATVNGGAGKSLYSFAPVVTAGGNVVTPAVGIDISNATQLFTTGTGTMLVTVWYNVLPY